LEERKKEKRLGRFHRQAFIEKCLLRERMGTGLLFVHNEERSAAVLNVLRRSAQGIPSPEKAATSKYEAKTIKKGAC
jgi:hypothetical protein